jgi:hypothetical protein
MILFAFGCQSIGGEIIFDGDQQQTQQLFATPVPLTRAGIQFDVPEDFTETSLDVWVSLWTNPPGELVKVGTITGITPGSTVTYTVPTLVPFNEYGVFLTPQGETPLLSINAGKADIEASQNVVASVFLRTIPREARSEVASSGWWMNMDAQDNTVFMGGYNDNAPLGNSIAAFHNVSSSDLTQTFSLNLVEPENFSCSIGQTSVLEDFNGDGSLEALISDWCYGDPQTEPRCGRLYYLDNIPEGNIAINDPSIHWSEGPAGCTPAIKNNFGRSLTYDPDRKIAIAGCPGCSYATPPCSSFDSNCGACAVFDMEEGMLFSSLTMQIGKKGDDICKDALFVDLNGNGIKDFVYTRTDEAPPGDCTQFNYVADDYTTEGVPLFTDAEPCADSNTMMLAIDANQDGIDDLALMKFSVSTGSGRYWLTIILGSESFNPASYAKYEFAGNELGGWTTVADINNDSIKDFIIFNERSMEFWIGPYDLTAAPDSYVTTDAGLGTVLYDVNGDGYMDFVRSSCDVVGMCSMVILY